MSPTGDEAAILRGHLSHMKALLLCNFKRSPNWAYPIVVLDKDKSHDYGSWT